MKLLFIGNSHTYYNSYALFSLFSEIYIIKNLFLNSFKFSYTFHLICTSIDFG